MTKKSILRLLTVAIAATALTSCGGVEDRHKEVKKLADREAWSEKETDQAIDYVVEGLNEVAYYGKDMELIEEKTDLRGMIISLKNTPAVKSRKSEIKAALKKRDKKRYELEKRINDYEDDAPDYDYSEFDAD